MILRCDSYDIDKNPEEKGFKHLYKLHEINGDSVIFDEATGLMCQQSGSELSMEYKEADSVTFISGYIAIWQFLMHWNFLL